jgi:hypothetical protein
MPELYTRRRFIYYSGILMGSLTLAACGGGSGSSPDGQNNNGGNTNNSPPRIIYRLSSRGRNISQAAKKHNANKRFASAAAAKSNRAHPGDTSRVVPLVVSASEFNRLFDNGSAQVADLRSF